ncbi:hypothetical protein ACLKA7_005195 [Drosophila subpalustris]
MFIENLYQVCQHLSEWRSGEADRCSASETRDRGSNPQYVDAVEKNSIMIYPRLFHRHIAITALYLLLTLGVLGLIIILCTFNDTEHTYLFKSGSTNSIEKQLPSSARLDYEKTTIVTTPRHSTKPQINLKQDSNDAGEQQHIYIDELYTETTKPKRVYDNYINYRKMKFPAGTKRTKNNSSSNSNYNGSHIESKINYYRALELTAPSPIPTLKLNNISNWSEKSAAFPFWTATQSKTRRIIGNERKSAERSRQLLLCEKGKSSGGGGGGELCRMLFKET